MYCGKCGKQVEDGVRFCPYCGNELTESGQKGNPTPVTRENAAGKHSTQNYRKTGIIAVAVLAVVVWAVVLGFVVAGGGYKRAAKKFAKAIEQGDGKAFLEVMNMDLVWDAAMDQVDDDDLIYFISYATQNMEYGKEYDEDELEELTPTKLESLGKDVFKKYIEEYFQEEIGDMLDEIEGVKIEIVDSNKLTFSEASDISDTYRRNLDVDVKIQSAAKVTYRATIVDGAETETEDMDMYFIKIKGKWYLDYSQLDALF